MSTKEKALNKLLEDLDIRNIITKKLESSKKEILEATYPDDILGLVADEVASEILDAVNHAVLSLAENWYNDDRRD